MALSETNPVYGPFFGVMGAASAIIFSGKFLKKNSFEERKKWMKIEEKTVKSSNFANFHSLKYFK